MRNAHSTREKKYYKKKIGKHKKKNNIEIDEDVHNLALMCCVILLDPMY